MAMVVSTLAVPQIGNAVATSTLVAYWNCDETSGVRADTTDNNNDLTDNNTVLYGTGIINNACDFEESNSEYLSIADASQTGLDITGNFSTSFWTKVESAPALGDQHILWAKYGASAGNRAYAMSYENNGGTYELWIRLSADGNSATWGDINYTLTPDTWYHIVTIYVASAGTFQIYVDGTSIGTISSLSTSIKNSGTAFQIGYNGDVGSYTDGLIDEIGFWSGTNLSAQDVTDLYNGGLGFAYPFTVTATTSTSTATTTSSVDVEELKWVLELYLAIFTFLLFTYLGYRFTKFFL